MSLEHATPARRLRLAAAAILAVCVAAAAIAFGVAQWGGASSAATADGAAFGPVAAAREMRQLERIGGKAAVYTLKFRQGFDSLWHGRRLALTLLGLGAALAGLCLHLASLADDSA